MHIFNFVYVVLWHKLRMALSLDQQIRHYLLSKQILN